MSFARKAMLLLVATALLASQIAWAAPAPAPSTKTSACALPNGVEVQAPESSGTSTQSYSYYYLSYSWSYYSSYYYSSYSYGRKLLQNGAAPSPSSAPKCCPTTITKQGDTVTGLISDAGLPDKSKVFFYAINPSVKNGTDTLTAGSVVTVPCYRITEFYRLAAQNAQAPTSSTQAPTSSNTTNSITTVTG